MSWIDFRDSAVGRMNAPGDPRLGYRLNTEIRRQWIPLTCDAEWKAAISIVAQRALSARTRAVSMQVKDMVRTSFLLRNSALTLFTAGSSEDASPTRREENRKKDSRGRHTAHQGRTGTRRASINPAQPAGFFEMYETLKAGDDHILLDQPREWSRQGGAS